MKNLKLKNSHYEHLQKAFAEWLAVLGFCPQSVAHLPIIIREFFHFLEQQGCKQLSELQQQHYKAYFNYISSRGNQRRDGGLSNNYINKHIQALEKLHEFLVHKGVQHLPPVILKQLKLEKGNMTVLTQEEIQAFYKVASKAANTITNC